MSPFSLLSLLILAVAVACAGDDGGATGTPPSTTGDDGESESEGNGSGHTPAMAAANCAGAPRVAPGRYAGSLRNLDRDHDLCGVEGAVAYLELAADRDLDLFVRADALGSGPQGVPQFVPRLALLPGCGGAAFACGDGSLEVRDLHAGSVLILAIGAPADEPALDLPQPAPGEVDPLAFTVDLDTLRILELGEACFPATRGRCPTGSRCQALEPEDPGDSDSEGDGDGDDDPGAAVCVALAGDTCASAERWVLDALVGSIVIDPAAPQTDAHAHTCAGEGHRERVLEVEIPAALLADLPEGAALELATKATVDLAVRGPGCEAAAELACAVATAGEGITLTIPEVAGGAIAGGGTALYLFVELPLGPAEGEGAPLSEFAVTWAFIAP